MAEKRKGYYLGGWWHSAGSDQRYRPRWWERDAYIEGLRDAIRITDAVRTKHWQDGKARAALAEAEKRIFDRARVIAPEINSDEDNDR